MNDPTVGAVAPLAVRDEREAPRFVEGRGLRLIDEAGTEYLDAVSGTFNLPLGYDHPRVVAATVEQLHRCAHMSSSFSRPYADELLVGLLAEAPPNIDAGWVRDLTGSTANECAVKVAQKSTGQRDVVSLHLSHHGQTVFTTTLSGQSFRRGSFPVLATSPGPKVPAPYCYRCPYGQTYPGCGLLCAEAVHDAVRYESSGSVACMIVEPVLGNGGNIVPPPGYFEALGAICEETGMLLIADEVQTGIGRTGQMFACETLDVPAHLITLAKGLGGIGVPAAAVLMESRLDVLEQFEHSFTSGGNMLALAASKATLEVVGEPGFLEGVRRRGELLGGLLRDLATRHPAIGDVRGVGMMWGLEIVDGDGGPDVEMTRRIIHAAESCHRLVLRGSSYGFGNVVKVRPALIASEDDLVEIVDLLSRSLRTAGAA